MLTTILKNNKTENILKLKSPIIGASGTYGYVDEFEIFRHTAYFERAVLTEIQNDKISLLNGELVADILQISVGVGEFYIARTSDAYFVVLEKPCGFVKIERMLDHVTLGKTGISVMDMVVDAFVWAIDFGDGSLGERQGIIVDGEVAQSDVLAAVEEEETGESGVYKDSVFSASYGEIFELFAESHDAAFDFSVRQNDVTLACLVAAADVLGQVDGFDFLRAMQNNCSGTE